ncbi:hypothetical protein PV367_09655 [Streptomyces europaeiscabiei]|uniref:Uncharacterized protein n=1 Tax=Streptomyces europaeiscabiei TaxID=146819 RepID=A0AAJ2UKA8_9ACTN|nr:hypothetical protein [Streptomyces europaeiscabiei]MDX3130048.1 hypothetical protein [Streptomyces europaeiscabiei]
MRKSDLGKSQSDPTLEEFPLRRRRGAWRQAQVRAMRYSQPAPKAHRGIPRARGAR